MTLTSCIDCGAPSPRAHCEQCRPGQRSRPSRAAGYDTAWDALSKRARRLQPWCSDCGTVDDLTCDHSPEAWQRKARGLPIRLADVDVVCRPCNSRRGSARGENPDAFNVRSPPLGKVRVSLDPDDPLDAA